MGLFAFCCFGIILLLIFILLILIMSFVVVCLKVGFKNAIKSKKGIFILALLFVFIGIPAIVVYLFMTPRSGEQLVKSYILNPVPKSVQVLESYDGGPDLSPETCLHFRIAPSDLKLILASKKWEPVSKPKYSGYGCDYRNNSWNFHSPTPLVGDDVKIYTYSPYAKDDEFLYVNAQMNEVYYFNVDMGLP